MDMRSDKFIDLLLEVSADNQGFNAAGDIITQTADGFDLNSIWGEFQAAVAAINAARQTIVDLLTFPVTQNIERVPQISSAQFEKASEYGEPRGIRPSGAYFNLGYDFEWYDLAARFTWKFLADATASQVEAINSMALEADNQLVFTKVMDALYNKNNREADINGQIVPVYALYNADGTVPPAYKTNTFTGSETHYLTSGAATIESEDLDVLYSKLRMKGYSAENGVQHVLLVNPAEGAVIRTFRVATGATYEGLNVIGRYGHILVVEDDLFPVGYVTLLGSGGRANLNNPVGIREHANAALRGLRLVKGPIADYPLIDSFYQRGFGTGIRQRGGAVVMQITASGTYTNPTILSGSA
jgi:hypothetical protein